MSNDMERLKKSYAEIEIPTELAAVTDAAIKRGKLEQKRRKKAGKSRWIKYVGASVASLFILFTVSINTMPAFASSLEQIPGLGALVRTLQFNNGSAGGGVDTDSTDINLISLQKKGESEEIVINFQKSNEAQQIVNSFGVKYSEYPNTMSFTIGGARKFSAEKDLALLKKSGLIMDAYQVMSLDDSLIRFNITFNQNVRFEVKEYKEPAQVIVTLTAGPSETSEIPVYSVRTISSPYGDIQGNYEELLFGLESVRTLKDDKGNYFVEAAYFKTEAEALTKLTQIKEAYSFKDNILFIERREPLQIPATTAEHNTK